MTSISAYATGSAAYITGISAVALISTLAYYWIKNKTKINYVHVCNVKKLIIYPIKSVGGIEVDHLEVTKNVLKYGKFKDRSWILLDKDDHLIAIKNEPKLALTKCSFHNGNELWIDAPDMETLKLTLIEKIDTNTKILNFGVYEEKMSGIDCGDDAHLWFQKFLGKTGIRIFQHHPDLKYRRTRSHGRNKDEEKFPVIYQNKSGLHLINENSIVDLNSRFNTDNHVDYRNFRPNVVIEGPSAYDEDNWLHMSINGVTFRQLLHCDRCPTTAVNRDTGKPGQETLTALQKFRPAQGMAKEKKLGPYFGVIYGPMTEGIIRINDPIVVSYGRVSY